MNVCEFLGEAVMSAQLVDKLLKSFDELDNCISVTKDVLAEKEGVPEEVVQRVNQYTDIVAKQRILAADLRSHISEQNWDEVSRHVKLINGLSSMIRDDAQAILSGNIEGADSAKASKAVC